MKAEKGEDRWRGDKEKREGQIKQGRRDKEVVRESKA